MLFSFHSPLFFSGFSPDQISPPKPSGEPLGQVINIDGAASGGAHRPEDETGLLGGRRRSVGASISPGRAVWRFVTDFWP